MFSVKKILRIKDEHFLSEFLAASRFVCNLKFSGARKAFSAALRSSVCSPFATLSGPLQAPLREDGSHPEVDFEKTKISSVFGLIKH